MFIFTDNTNIESALNYKNIILWKNSKLVLNWNWIEKRAFVHS